jgi:hypothetical protein
MVKGSPTFLVTKDPMEVCSVSGERMLSDLLIRLIDSLPIRPITRRHSLFPPSSARTLMDLPYGWLTLLGDEYGFIVFRVNYY